MRNKQFKKEDWLYWFGKYESDNLNWNEYFKVRDLDVSKKYSIYQAKKRFRNKYILYKTHGSHIIENMCGKDKWCKKKKDITWDDFTREDLIEIAKRYQEIQEEKKKKNKMQENKSLGVSISKCAWLLNLSESGIYKNRKNKFKSRRNPLWEKLIQQEFYANNKIYGRRRLTMCIFQKYNVYINSRTVGNYMNALGLQCTTRRKTRKPFEYKNCVKNVPNLVKRNYNQKDVIATDVTYIPIKSKNTKHAYLSIAINHENKMILSWKLSENNDIVLVYNTLKKLNTNKNTIIHSDHGVQYSSFAVQKLAQNKGYQMSMSRIGNCLDNREAEYFFSNLKGEVLNKINTSNINITELRQIIAKYIKWYNYERIQGVLNWKTPYQFKQNSVRLV